MANTKNKTNLILFFIMTLLSLIGISYYNNDILKFYNLTLNNFNSYF